jgi:hypothetical protein
MPGTRFIAASTAITAGSACRHFARGPPVSLADKIVVVCK